MLAIYCSETIVCAPFISSGPQGFYLNLLVKSNALTVELNPLSCQVESNYCFHVLLARRPTSRR